MKQQHKQTKSVILFETNYKLEYSFQVKWKIKRKLAGQVIVLEHKDGDTKMGLLYSEMRSKQSFSLISF